MLFRHTEWQIDSLEELQDLLAHGDAAKRRAATAMNDHSTRAHTCFVLSLQLKSRRSRFYFADLGGSEQLSKSKVDAATRAKVTVPRKQSLAELGERFSSSFKLF